MASLRPAPSLGTQVGGILERCLSYQRSGHTRRLLLGSTSAHPTIAPHTRTTQTHAQVGPNLPSSKSSRARCRASRMPASAVRAVRGGRVDGCMGVGGSIRIGRGRVWAELTEGTASRWGGAGCRRTGGRRPDPCPWGALALELSAGTIGLILVVGYGPAQSRFPPDCRWPVRSCARHVKHTDLNLYTYTHACVNMPLRFIPPRPDGPANYPL